MKKITELTVEDNTFIYAINDVTQRGKDIAQGDPRVKQILQESKAKTRYTDYCCSSAHTYDGQAKRSTLTQISWADNNYSKLTIG